MRVLTAAALLLALQEPVQQAQQAAWTAIDLHAKDTDIDGGSCHWDAQAAAPFRLGAGNHIEVNCDTASAAAILRCDPAGFEPRDASATTLCASPALEFDAARTAAIVTSAATDLRVTWLRALESPQMETRAIRAPSPAARFEIAVAPPTFVRLAPAGASPRTLLSGTLTGASTFALRTDNPGGEIFARRARATVEPAALEVAQVGRRSPLTFASSWFSLPDQTPGQYLVTRVYSGGVRTGAVPVTVRATRTSDVWLPAERVGGVHVSADPIVCAPDSRFELLPVAGLSDKPVVSTSAERCQWTVGGLSPGLYRAHIAADPIAGTPADADFTISSQEWVDVQLIPPPVIVRGRILVLGRPVVRRDVQFTPAHAPTVIATTDDEGRFVVGLPAAGVYEVNLDAAPLGRRTYQPEFLFGENRYELDIRGALLRVRLTQDGVTPKGPVTLRIRGPRDTIERVITTFDRPAEFDGLPFGPYVLSARASNGLESLDQGVTLTDKASSALVWLDVSRERRVVRVQTESGMPVRQATIVVSGGGSASLEVPDGLFKVPPLAVRTPIYVTSAGFSPTCIIVTGANEEQATMVSRIGRVELRFPHAPGQTTVSGDLYGIPWATCPVPIERADGQLIPHAGYDSVIVKLPIGQLQIERAGVRTIFDVPGFPVIVK